MLKGLVYIFVNDTTVQSLVGLNAAGTAYKVYPNIATQEEQFPLVVVYQAGRVPEYCKGQAPNQFTYRYEAVIYTEDYDSCNDIALALISSIDGVFPSTVNGVNFITIQNTDCVDGNFISEYAAYTKTVSFEAFVDES